MKINLPAQYQTLLRIAVCMLSLASASCIQPKIQKLAIYVKAVNLGVQSELRCLWNGEYEVSDLPSIVPYAIIYAVRDGTTRGEVAEYLAKKAKESFAPDLIIFSEGSPTYAGSVYSGGLYGGFSIPVYQQVVTGLCFRLCQGRIGIRADKSNMVVELLENARQSGLLEGDTIVSIGGYSLDLDSYNSPHYAAALTAKPTHEIPIVWIRPGVGRMSGNLLPAENPALHNSPGLGYRIEEIKRNTTNQLPSQ